ncbi:MAG: hypothetical protein DDT32_01663 [Syntrophomonadaceae bacterium]|nr:hypothetical protein [Bacillota bacterium]
MPAVAHNRGATPQWPKDGTPRRARSLLGCDCVAHRFRSALATLHSSFLVSLQNHLWQMVNIILIRPLTIKILGILLLFDLKEKSDYTTVQGSRVHDSQGGD